MKLTKRSFLHRALAGGIVAVALLSTNPPTYAASIRETRINGQSPNTLREYP
ncbi:MAG: hypothetical protein ABIS50_23875 [Luteolibacter sp.]|uniref:hypothetical protein n=1 Tax=Luteolibacter sp. TaxID=1962973 RepID=UPI0032651657